MLRLRFSIPAILIVFVAIVCLFFTSCSHRTPEITLGELSSYPFDQQQGQLTDIPSEIRSRDGTRVVITGEMWQPQSTITGAITDFQLTDFSRFKEHRRPPQIQWFVHAKVPRGKSVSYSPGIVRVIGKLHVNLIHDEEGRICSVYQLDVEAVEPVTSPTLMEKIAQKLRFWR